MAAAPQRSTIGVLMSGGLDSSILVGSLLDQAYSVQPFYVRCGVVWEQAEIRAAERFLSAISCPALRPLVILKMPLRDVYSDHWSISGAGTPGADSPDEAVYLPGRNAMLLVKAAVWCQLNGISSLALAPLGTSPFKDASPNFIAQFEAAINCGAPAEVQLVLPFATMNKLQVMQLGRNQPLQHTFSCISPVDGLHCGFCNKCAERQQAFRLAELPDPTRYDTEQPVRQR